MHQKKLSNMEYGEFQEYLVRTVMNKIEEIETKSSLVYFPIVHDRVESFLLAHWEQVWQDCRTLTWKEWLHSSCYDLFRSEVIDDILASNHVLELSPVKEITKS